MLIDSLIAFLIIALRSWSSISNTGKHVWKGTST